MKYTHPFGNGEILNEYYTDRDYKGYDFSPGIVSDPIRYFNFNKSVASHLITQLTEDFFTVYYPHGISLYVDWRPSSVRKGRFIVRVSSVGIGLYESEVFFNKETRKKRELLEYIYEAHVLVLKIIDSIENKGMSKNDFLIKVE